MSQIVTGSPHKENVKQIWQTATKLQKLVKAAAAEACISDSCRRKQSCEEGDKSSIAKECEDEDHNLCFNIEKDMKTRREQNVSRVQSSNSGCMMSALTANHIKN